MITLAAAPAATSSGTSWTTVLFAILGSGVVSTLITTLITGLRGASATRRDRYAAAVETMVAWREYPYRIRRRTSDDPDTLSKLADLGHDIQERLARHLAWIAGDSTVMLAAFDHAMGEVRTPIGDACADAWNSTPMMTPTEMNLAGWGPGATTAPVERRLECAVSWRFGWKRLVPRQWVENSLRKAGTLP